MESKDYIVSFRMRPNPNEDLVGIIIAPIIISILITLTVLFLNDIKQPIIVVIIFVELIYELLLALLFLYSLKKYKEKRLNKTNFNPTISRSENQFVLYNIEASTITINFSDINNISYLFPSGMFYHKRGKKQPPYGKITFHLKSTATFQKVSVHYVQYPKETKFKLEKILRDANM
ncbi:MAG: hypothetical protein LBF12_01450 [Christensenellaceae bacterium]|jgi:hypothetical protein|nr:hypothetical protein [Christensenellaceae bacterium]